MYDPENRNPAKRSARKIQSEIREVDGRYCQIEPYELKKKETHRRWIAKIADPTAPLDRKKLTMRMRWYLWKNCRHLPTKNLKVRALRQRLAVMSREENANWYSDVPYANPAADVEAAEKKNRKERCLIVGIIGTIFYKDPIQCLKDN